MAKEKNYLIGKAEELTRITPPPKIRPQSRELYTITEVLQRLAPQLKQVNNELKKLDSSLCPRGYSVARMTLHPSFIAKGHFPKQLLREMGVRAIGSKATEVKPDKWMREGPPEKSPSTSIFIAGKIENFVEFEKKLREFTKESYVTQDLMKVWSFENIPAISKLKENHASTPGYFEVGIQFIPGGSSEFIKQSFMSHAQKLQFSIRDDLSLEVSNL